MSLTIRTQPAAAARRSVARALLAAAVSFAAAATVASAQEATEENPDAVTQAATEAVTQAVPESAPEATTPAAPEATKPAATETPESSAAPEAVEPPATPVVIPPAPEVVATPQFVEIATAPAAKSSPSTQPSSRATDVVSDGINADGKLVLMVNKSQVVTTKLPYKTVNVANPETADFNQVNNYEILVTAKKPGNTQLTIWDVAGLSQNIDVTVMSDLEALQAQLDKIFPGTGIQATNVNGTIALRGRVRNLEVAKQAEAIAAPYSDKVLNFLEIAGGQQVMLKVRFAEVSRSASSQLGFNGFATNGKDFATGVNQGAGGSPVGAFASGASDVAINPAVTVFGAGHVGSYSFEAFVQALRQNNLLRVLAEPNVIAISGEQASFLAGGEFPIPVPQSGGDSGDTITIEYKQFGVKLNFLPTVLGDGKIRLKVEPEVSDLDYSRSVSFKGFTIPGLTKRTLSTTIELNEGQSFAVAGLLNNRIVANKNVTPLLGDLPIVGALFRSMRYERSETELVVLVTPHVVAAVNPDQVGELPGERWKDPTELQLFLDRNVGSIEGRGAKAGKKDAKKDGKQGSSNTTATANGSTPESTEPARFRGQYGFVPATN
jgi:pilus assembly protein CpaC